MMFFLHILLHIHCGEHQTISKNTKEITVRHVIVEKGFIPTKDVTFPEMLHNMSYKM